MVGHRFRLGVDIGGTFTDLVVIDETEGEVYTAKTPTNHSDPTQGVYEGITALCLREGIPSESIHYFVHGTTLATNTIIEQTGAPTGLLITEGFRDVLEIRRLRLRNTTNFYDDKPKPLVPRKWVVEIGERLLASGQVYRSLDPGEVRRAVQGLVDQGVRAIAICFLHSYRNPEHERAAVQLVRREFPDIFVSASHEIWPQQREYERALITVINSYVGQRMSDYLVRLRQEAEPRALLARMFITRSNGGVMTTHSAAKIPAATLLSGPAAGVMGGAFLARHAGFDRVITLDMGGTSADVAVINSQVEYSTENEVGDFPVIMPAVDISAIGAGGGSIAWIDSAGVLKIGPQSAGSHPGPAAYGRGGHDATVTDAYIVLGLLDPEKFLGGDMRLRPDLAYQAVSDLGVRLKMDPMMTAHSILEVTTAKMYAQFTPLMARKGFDPRDFVLMAYGGAGPTHAFMLAREVSIDRVLVPLSPGTFCALGGLVTDIKNDFVKTVYLNTSETTVDQLEAEFQAIEAEARDWIRREVEEHIRYLLVRTADMRYLGQAFEINVQLPSRVTSLEELAALFHDRYQEIYGQADPGTTIELVNIRCVVAGEVTKPALNWRRTAADGGGGPSPRRQIWYEQRAWEVDVYQRADLAEGRVIAGPAIVEQYDTTTFVPPGWTIHVDPHLNLVGERDGNGAATVENR